ncbi:enoyl-CoA hydratase-related protein [Desulfomonile tiedjei]|uniref:Enoyl-CoA hydratase/carnithine racemase n=1 Tax=Desulfomonile tiedjei (strain ATCC 49306 / DSM 6799 / DCB-1) TaxID=706587 RepID=I4CDI6_DESTA|nr:enoyl-CoA hydratase-related protein [Desulfomonile tiedjei]AFM27627.1 enoyl-CoA hydratase/carnithine racemase [Desulfomonile tiedjei DSM 6799]
MTEQQSSNLVIYERDGYVGMITLSRPERRNALNLQLWNDLGRAVAAAEEDTEVRVILLRGAGKSFCAGLDLSPDNEIISIITGVPNAAQKTRFYKTVRRIQQIHNRFENIPVPVIGVLHGHCLGAGLELALCCDFRLCSADTVFSLPEATLAIITDVGGLQRLPRVVGQGPAREIAYRGNRFGADYALRINLVNESYPDQETLNRKAMEIALEIAGNPPLAVQGAKNVLLYSDTLPVDCAQDYTAARSAMLMPSDDLMEAMAAYMQKRKGEFKGA